LHTQGFLLAHAALAERWRHSAAPQRMRLVTGVEDVLGDAIRGVVETRILGWQGHGAGPAAALGSAVRVDVSPCGRVREGQLVGGDAHDRSVAGMEVA